MFLQKSPKFNPPKFYYDGARILDALTLFYFNEINGGNDGQQKGKSDFTAVQYDEDEDFMLYYKDFIQTGLQLKQCFEKALKICEDIKLMIEKQIKIEYPIETFSDKFVKK
ncbi:hypothetical protein ABPG72_005895 [Tetrahymena utriculariae]